MTHRLDLVHVLYEVRVVLLVDNVVIVLADVEIRVGMLGQEQAGFLIQAKSELRIRLMMRTGPGPGTGAARREEAYLDFLGVLDAESASSIRTMAI